MGTRTVGTGTSVPGNDDGVVVDGIVGLPPPVVGAGLAPPVLTGGVAGGIVGETTGGVTGTGVISVGGAAGGKPLKTANKPGLLT